MQENKSMQIYKVSIFERIKRKFVSIFLKNNKKTDKVATNDIKQPSYTEEDKKEFLRIYNAAKEGTIDLATLDKGTLYKVMLLANEEMQIKSKKLKEEIDEMNTHIDNLRIYNKQISLLNKNS